MGLELTISKHTHTQILETICARNTNADLLCNPENGITVRARVRFLKLLAPDQLMIDRPSASKRPLHLPAGAFLGLRFVCNEQRLTFTTQVIQEGRYEDAGLEVPALIVAVPTDIERDQRRHCYRVPMLLRVPPIVTTLTEIDAIGPEKIPQFRGIIQNVSETGAAILIQPAAGPIKQGDIYTVWFKVEDVPDAFEFVGEVRWVRQTPSEQLSIGVAWRLDQKDPEVRRIQTELAKFLMAEQRRAILRRRD